MVLTISIFHVSFVHIKKICVMVNYYMQVHRPFQNFLQIHLKPLELLLHKYYISKFDHHEFSVCDFLAAILP